MPQRRQRMGRRLPLMLPRCAAKYCPGALPATPRVYAASRCRQRSPMPPERYAGGLSALFIAASMRRRQPRVAYRHADSRQQIYA